MLRELMVPAMSPERVGPLFWAQARIDYGLALRELGKDDDAERFFNDAITEIRAALGADHYFLAVAENELADLYVRKLRWGAAVANLNDAYRIFRLRTGEHGQATLLVQGNLGIVQFRNGQTREAAATLAAAHAELSRLLGESSPQAQSVGFYLASALAAQNEGAEADKLLPPLKPTDLAAAEPRNDWAPRLEALRGTVLLETGQAGEAVKLLSEAVSEMEKLRTPAADLEPVKQSLRLALAAPSAAKN